MAMDRVLLRGQPAHGIVSGLIFVSPPWHCSSKSETRPSDVESSRRLFRWHDWSVVGSARSAIAWVPQAIACFYWVHMDGYFSVPCHGKVLLGWFDGLVNWDSVHLRHICSLFDEHVHTN